MFPRVKHLRTFFALIAFFILSFDAFYLYNNLFGNSTENLEELIANAPGKLLLIDLECLKRILDNLECDFPLRVAAASNFPRHLLNANQFLRLEFLLDDDDDDQGHNKDFWLFHSIGQQAKATSANDGCRGRRAVRRFNTRTAYSASARLRSLFPLLSNRLDVPSQIPAFLRAWKNEKFFDCGNDNGEPILKRVAASADSPPPNIPSTFSANIAAYSKLIAGFNGTVFLHGGTLLARHNNAAFYPVEPIYAHFGGNISEPIPFKKQFRWPPFDVNVHNEVSRALKGQHPVHTPIDYWNKFAPVHSPTCTGKEATLPAGNNNSLLIIVKTGVERYQHRSAVRQSYAKVRQVRMKDGSSSSEGGGHFHFRTIFVMGKGNGTVLMERVDEEARKHNDLLVVDFVDDYYANTLKFINAIKFGHQRNCFSQQQSFPFVLLIDDDFLLLPWNLTDEVVKYSPDKRLYTGFVTPHDVLRDNRDKFKVTLSQYPFDAYPPFVSGGCVLLSRRTVHELFVAIQHTQLFILDDVYTGILAHLLDIFAKHNPNFFESPHALTQKGHNVIAAGEYSPKMLKEAYMEEAEKLANKEANILE